MNISDGKPNIYDINFPTDEYVNKSPLNNLNSKSFQKIEIKKNRPSKNNNVSFILLLGEPHKNQYIVVIKKKRNILPKFKLICKLPLKYCFPNQ